MGELVDREKELERIQKDIENLKFEIARSQKMLSNPGFVGKAPAQLVEAEKAKLDKNSQALERLQSELEKF